MPNRNTLSEIILRDASDIIVSDPAIAQLTLEDKITLVRELPWEISRRSHAELPIEYIKSNLESRGVQALVAGAETFGFVAPSDNIPVAGSIGEGRSFTFKVNHPGLETAINQRHHTHAHAAADSHRLDMEMTPGQAARAQANGKISRQVR